MNMIRRSLLSRKSIPKNYTGKTELVDEKGRVYVTRTYKNGKENSFNDEPSDVYANGTKYWYKNGKLHRGNGKPAVIEIDCSRIDIRTGNHPVIYEYWINGEKVTKKVAETYDDFFPEDSQNNL